ncbi:hypothetical protein KKB17_05770 [bacterium]|nr:hypothetical protein [bacterium]
MNPPPTKKTIYFVIANNEASLPHAKAGEVISTRDCHEKHSSNIERSSSNDRLVENNLILGSQVNNK